MMIEMIKLFLFDVVEITGMALEACGIIILVYSGVRSFASWITRKGVESSLELAEGIALALEFLLAAEVLHTIIAEQVSDLIVLGALVVLRAVMTVEIQYELKNEKKALMEEKK